MAFKIRSVSEQFGHVRKAIILVLVAVALLAGPRLLVAQTPSYSIHLMGLYDALHTRNDGFHASSLKDTTTTGFADGTSTRYNDSQASGMSAWVYNGAAGTSTRIGLIDPGQNWNSSPSFLNAQGQVAGITQESSSIGASQWTWYYDPATASTTQIGFYSGAQYAQPNGYQNSTVNALTPSGYAFGASQQFSGYNYLGSATWAYDPSARATTRIGLVGSDYTNASTGAQYSAFSMANTQGFAAGVSAANPGDTGLGGTIVAWCYDPTTLQTTAIGLNNPSGGPWPGVTDGILGVTENRVVLGQLGSSDQEAVWAYKNSTGVTTRIGFYSGSEFVSPNGKQQSAITTWNSVGQTIGTSTRYRTDNFPNGYAAWIYDPATTTTTRLGYTDAAHTTTNTNYQNSFLGAINPSGMVIGGSERLAVQPGQTKGMDAWLYNPATHATTQLGNTTNIPGTSGYQYNIAQAINSQGQVVGWAQQTSGFAGQAMWMYDSASNTTRQIGLSGSLFTHPTDGYRVSGLSFLNNAGQVAGYSFRLGVYPYNSDSGQDAWLYDYSSNTTKDLVFATSSQNLAYSLVTYLGSDGLVLGKYQTYDANGRTAEMHPFYGSLSTGFYDLNTLVSGGLASQGWQSLGGDLSYLGSVLNSSPSSISALSATETMGWNQLATDLTTDGWEQFVGVGTRLDGSQLPFVMSEAPEPSTGLLLLLAAVAGSAGAAVARRRHAPTAGSPTSPGESA
jgi:hypothetical protein